VTTRTINSVKKRSSSDGSTVPTLCLRDTSDILENIPSCKLKTGTYFSKRRIRSRAPDSPLYLTSASKAHFSSEPNLQIDPTKIHHLAPKTATRISTSLCKQSSDYFASTEVELFQYRPTENDWIVGTSSYEKPVRTSRVQSKAKQGHLIRELANQQVSRLYPFCVEIVFLRCGVTRKIFKAISSKLAGGSPDWQVAWAASASSLLSLSLTAGGKIPRTAIPEIWPKDNSLNTTDMTALPFPTRCRISKLHRFTSNNGSS